MKIRDGFVLQTKGGKNLVVPQGEMAKRYSGSITLNETGAFLWEMLAEGATRQSLLDEVLDACQVDATRVAADIDTFLRWLIDAELLTDEDGKLLTALPEEEMQIPD